MTVHSKNAHPYLVHSGRGPVHRSGPGNGGRARRAQASLEALIASLFALVALVFVLFANSGMSERTQSLTEISSQKTECAKLQTAMEWVYSSSGNAAMELAFVNDFNISQKLIRFNGYYCTHNAAPMQKSLAAGKAVVSKVGGVFNVSNL